MGARHLAPIRRRHEDGTSCTGRAADCFKVHTVYFAACQADDCDWTSDSPTRAIVEEAKRIHQRRAGGEA